MRGMRRVHELTKSLDSIREVRPGMSQKNEFANDRSEMRRILQKVTIIRDNLQCKGKGVATLFEAAKRGSCKRC